MRRRYGLLAWGLFALWSCQAPISTGLQAPTITVRGRLMTSGYATQAIVSAPSVSDVDHVRLTLLSDTGGGYQPTGAQLRVDRAALGAPVSLGRLKIDRRYRVLAEAFATASESVPPISDPSLSTTDFLTPGIVPDARGVPTIPSAPVALVALRLKLADATYSGRARFTLSIEGNFPGANALSAVRVTLYQVGADGALTERHARSVPVAEAAGHFPLTALRHGTAYRLQAEGLRADGNVVTNPATSRVDFATPAVVAGRVEDTLPDLVLPVRR